MFSMPKNAELAGNDTPKSEVSSSSAQQQQSPSADMLQNQLHFPEANIFGSVEIPVDIIYTDGSVVNSRFFGRSFGAASFFCHKYGSFAYRLESRTITPNEAEVHAALHAIKYARLKGWFKLTIFTDSTFLVDNGNELNACSIEKIRWDKIKECVPLFEEMADLIHHRRSPMRMKFDHCQGHSDIYGNEQADKAAKEMTQRMYLDALNQSNINPNNFPLLHRCPTRVLTRTYLLPVLLPVCNSNLLLSMPTRRSMSSHQTEILSPPIISIFRPLLESIRIGLT